jgi:hypothetical protein
MHELRGAIKAAPMGRLSLERSFSRVSLIFIE